MTLARSKVSISVERTLMPLHVAGEAADLDPVALLHRPLDQEDDARDEVRDDVLQAEADADRQRAGDDREARQVEPGRGDRDQRRDRDADVADAGEHRVAAAGVEPGARQHRAAQHRLQQPHHPDAEGEDDDQRHDRGRRQTDAAERHALAQRASRSRRCRSSARPRSSRAAAARRAPPAAATKTGIRPPSSCRGGAVGLARTDWAILFSRSKTTSRLRAGRASGCCGTPGSPPPAGSRPRRAAARATAIKRSSAARCRRSDRRAITVVAESSDSGDVRGAPRRA